MRVDITQNTLKAEIQSLKGVGPVVVREFINDTTLLVHKTAVRGIQRGPATGRFYQKYQPRRAHQASAPGEFPQSDTGRLAASVQFELPTSTKNPKGFVGTNLLYGRYLEFKSPTRGGRPWLRRSFNEAVKSADRVLAKIFRRRNR